MIRGKIFNNYEKQEEKKLRKTWFLLDCTGFDTTLTSSSNSNVKLTFKRLEEGHFHNC